MSVPTGFTFNGQIVQFTDADRALLAQDQAKIDEFQGIIDVESNEYGIQAAKYNTANGINCGNNSPFDGGSYESCMANRSTLMGAAEYKRNQAKAKWDSAVSSLADWVNNYNNDLKAIKDRLTDEIAAAQQNIATGVAQTQSQIAINQNDPKLLLEKEKEKTKQLLAQQQLKEKRILFGFIIVTLLVISVVVIRKIV